jgi:hypothetical protein
MILILGMDLSFADQGIITNIMNNEMVESVMNYKITSKKEMFC